MSNKLRIISYNCQSFNLKINMVQNLLSQCDILLLQETLICENSYVGFDDLHNDFISAYIPAVRPNNIFSGRASGGLAIFWRKADNISYHPIYYPDRIVGLKIEVHNVTYLLLNAYFYCDYGDFDSLLNYRSMLANISNIIINENCDESIVIGDLNADPYKGRFFKDLYQFCATNSFFMPDIEQLPKAS